MMDALGEAAIHESVRFSVSSSVQHQEAENRKAEDLRARRPVESAEDAQKPRLALKREDEGRRRTVIESGRIVIEKYDADGKLVRKIPPGYVPFRERV